MEGYSLSFPFPRFRRLLPVGGSCLVKLVERRKERRVVTGEKGWREDVNAAQLCARSASKRHKNGRRAAVGGLSSQRLGLRSRR